MNLLQETAEVFSNANLAQYLSRQLVNLSTNTG